MHEYDRFGLEEEIMKVWNTTVDLDSIIYAILDAKEPPDEDRLTNLLMGVRELHEIRMQKLMDYFEALIHDFDHKDNKKLVGTPETDLPEHQEWTEE